MPFAPNASADGTYISGAASLRILKAGWYRLQTAAIAGEVRTQVLPGRAIRYHRGDVERLSQAGRRTLETAGA
jgi:hypothetical protein